MPSREVLLNPGPVTLTERVRAALLRPDLCHREPEFAELTTRILRSVEAVYDERPSGHDAVLVTGSGTCAVEAMVASLVPRAEHALVVANGVYGERIAAMLTAQGKAFTLVRSEWLEPIDLDGVRQALAGHRYAAVLAVHHETTVGRLNRLDELGRLCRDADVPLLLDAVSSFGGEAIEWDAWHLGAVAGTANKCLHGVPGVSFVLADRDLLRARRGSSPSLYLDLAVYHGEQARGGSPYTQAVHACFALDEALAELADEGGWRARRDRYRARTVRLRSGLAEVGVGAALPATESASMLTSFRLPPDTHYAELHDRLKRAGYVIYAGQGRLETELFRIATMGAIDEADLDRVVAAIGAAAASAP